MTTDAVFDSSLTTSKDGITTMKAGNYIKEQSKHKSLKDKFGNLKFGMSEISYYMSLTSEIFNVL